MMENWDDRQGFSEAYMRVAAGDQAKLRNEIIEKCGWKTRVTFYQKKNGVRPVRFLEKPVIEAVFRSYGVDPWNPKVSQKSKLVS